MTTIRINLLPHREQKRALQQKTLVAMLAGGAVVGILIVAIGHMIIGQMTDAQNQRNEFLKSEIAKLDEQIKEIAKLKEKTNSLLARKKVVESLQSNRSEAVHLFDELARRLPDGLYLKGFKQAGNNIDLQGYAQSSARVSTLMRNLDDSPWFELPVLVEVKAATQNNLRVHEFIMKVKQTSPEQDNADGEKPKKG